MLTKFQSFQSYLVDNWIWYSGAFTIRKTGTPCHEPVKTGINNAVMNNQTPCIAHLERACNSAVSKLAEIPERFLAKNMPEG